MKTWSLLAACLSFTGALSEEEVEEPQEILTKPYVEPLTDMAGVVFWENFQSTSSDPASIGWILSTHEDYSNQSPLIEELDSAFEGDKELILKQKHARYGLSKKLEAPLDLDQDEIVIQFDARYHDKLTCSGSYIKFVAETDEAQESFSEKTPYVLMFGPDKCGNNEKVHVIFRHENPISGEFEEKHMVDVGKGKNDKYSHTYTLQLKKDGQEVQVFVDREEKKSSVATETGSFEPDFLPKSEIPDPDDKKPADWVDEKKIPDPEAKKPTDWVDERLIVDPESTKPDDWDDEEDGEWEPARIENPEFKGEWKAPMIDNPEYKGPWSPKNIPNPNFFEQKLPLSNLPKISHVFIEVLANDQDIAYDNILITTKSEVARNIAENHSLKAQALEKEILNERKLKQDKVDREKALEESLSVETVFNYVSGEMSELFERYPYATIGTTAAASLALVYLLLKPKVETPVEKTEKEEKESKSETAVDKDEKEDEKENTTGSEGLRQRPRRAD